MRAKNSCIILTISLIMFFTGITSAQAKTHSVQQENKSFVREGKKLTSIHIKKGDSVDFKNNDSVFHVIFSMSKIQPFNLGTFGNGDSKSMKFDKAGKIKVSCAIHPRMNINVVVGN